MVIDTWEISETFTSEIREPGIISKAMFNVLKNFCKNVTIKDEGYCRFSEVEYDMSKEVLSATMDAMELTVRHILENTPDESLDEVARHLIYAFNKVKDDDSLNGVDAVSHAGENSVEQIKSDFNTIQDEIEDEVRHYVAYPTGDRVSVDNITLDDSERVKLIRTMLAGLADISDLYDFD